MSMFIDIFHRYAQVKYLIAFKLFATIFIFYIGNEKKEFTKKDEKNHYEILFFFILRKTYNVYNSRL